MSWWKKLFSSGVKEVTSGVGDLAIDIRQAIKGKEYDPDKLLELESQMIQNKAKQIELNTQDAKSKNKFQANWRPFMGWVAGTAMGMYFIPQFALSSFIWAKMCLEQNKILSYPTLAAENHLFELVVTLLGLAGYRTYEKYKKVNNR